MVRWLFDAGTPLNSERYVRAESLAPISAHWQLRLLQQCLTWMGEGSYTWLLETLLACSLDASDVSPRLLSAWPRACYPCWWAIDHSDDPFFVRAVSMLAKDYCSQHHPYLDQCSVLLMLTEFGGTTRLQLAILRGDYLLVEALLAKDASRVNTDRNFLATMHCISPFQAQR